MWQQSLSAPSQVLTMDYNRYHQGSPKMHINPYFIPKQSSIPHFNPNFHNKPTAIPIPSQKIHINPRFVQQNQITSSSHRLMKDTVGIFTKPATSIHHEQNTVPLRERIKPAHSVGASTSRYKFVKPDYQKPNQMLPQTANTTSEMYKNVKLTSTATTPTTPLFKTKYSLVRNNKPQNPIKPAPSKQLQRKMVNISRYKSVVLHRILPKKFVSQTVKKLHIPSHADAHMKSVHRKIDRRAKVIAKQKTNTTDTNKFSVPLRKHCTNLVIIQGQKFSATSKSLRLISPSKNTRSVSENTQPSTPRLRVRVNGRVYVQKSRHLFIRKCVGATLKKNNIPCPSYRKYGRCVRNDKGKCALMHDKRYVVICREFLKGKCTKEDCLLSHQVSAEKMPTCSFFLQGCCTREVCPYLHVKLNDSARVCVDFVKGYCERGERCPKKHVNLCPLYAERGNCTRPKCPYPHKKEDHKIKRHTEVKVKSKVKKKKEKEADSVETEVELQSESRRYYVVDSEENVNGEIRTSRSKLGTLPSFIKI